MVFGGQGTDTHQALSVQQHRSCMSAVLRWLWVWQCGDRALLALSEAVFMEPIFLGGGVSGRQEVMVMVVSKTL